MKKKNRPGAVLKRALCVLLAIFLLVFAASCTIESTQQHYAAESAPPASGAGTVRISIDCKTVLDHWDELEQPLKKGDYIPKDGVILKETEYPYSDGDSVFSLLQKAAKEHKLQLEFQGAEANQYGSAYVQGLGHLYEFSCGANSGWFFSVNGKFPSAGSGNVPLSDGDRVKWVYSCDLGRDIGAALEP